MTSNEKVPLEDIVSVNVVRAGSSYVSMEVKGVSLVARIDSGAEISILSSTVYDKFVRKPGTLKDVNMKMADGTVLLGFIVHPVNMEIGRQTFKERLYVAPISDEMLLGHDLLLHLGVLLDLKSDTLVINNEHIPLNTHFKDGKPVVARVTIAKRTVVPPNSVVRLKCDMCVQMKDYFVEPKTDMKLVVPRVVRHGGDCPVVSFINPSENYRVLKKGSIIGNAYECSEFQEDPFCEQSADVTCSTVKEGELCNHQCEKGPKEVPSHLQEMYVKSIVGLNEEQAKELAKLLCNFQDVFAKDDYDLGSFNQIEH
ncbi:hypothetical protein DPMN_100257 [Dreissena polymorpha]|uniref:Peptidase A2 domain-containing protein n=1 Tax=Dreissena polymorpha TaxID=45954 RepID=A0A9D4LGQ1_DREPO|nr:hypothetical protein DPMN_100257 [Dreissena polymorpha]